MLVATESLVLAVDTHLGEMRAAGSSGPMRPTCLAADPHHPGRAWCGTRRDGVHVSEDGGRSWRGVGLAGEHITAVAASPVRPDLLWAGTEPSALWRSEDGGRTWDRAHGLSALPSAPRWSFPPKPETHHVRWIACHPRREGQLWLAIEAGALVSTPDGGRTWRDRVPGGPYDTHELAIHPDRPDTLRSAAGDGYYQSDDGGLTWDRSMDGLDVGYFRSVAIAPGDPQVAILSGATGPRTTYVVGRADGRLYRREADGRWERVTAGWPERPSTIAPLLASGREGGELWAADERGVHRSDDHGRSWTRVAPFPALPDHLRGLVLLAG